MSARTPSIIIALNRLTYSQKFIIISLLFVFSLVVCGYFMVRDQREKIRLTRLEQKGIIYLRGLQKLMENIPEHQWIAYQYLSGDTHLKGEVASLATEITADFKYLNNIDLNLRDLLGTLPEDFHRQDLPDIKPSQLEKEWNHLTNNLQSLTPQKSNELHDSLIENLRNLMVYIGESSNLILDPSAEIYYFIQTVIWDLPSAQILIPKMITVLHNVFKQNSLDVNDMHQMLVLTAFLEENVKDLKQDTRKALHSRFISEQDSLMTQDVLQIPLNKYLNAIHEWLTFVEDVTKNAGNTDTKNSEAFNNSNYLSKATNALESNFALSEATTEQMIQILDKRLAKYKQQLAVSIFLSLLSAMIGLSLGLYVMRQISKPLNNLVEAAKRLEEGDLSSRVQIANDNEVRQVGIAFNQMAEAFQEIIGRLQRTSSQLTTSTTEIASAARQQESSIVEQERTTRQIASTAHSISSTSKKFAKTLNDVSTNAEQTSSLAASGKQGLNQMEIIMQQMVDASQTIASKLAILNEKASNITSVVTTISKVADQTNLLSLNAAIEAEKAGEHGRTFSVIAREIRRLADQTANATLDIEKMVTEIVASVSAGVMSVDKFSEEINSGVSQVAIVGGQLTKIIEQVQQQTLSFEKANQGMQAQSVEAEQINEAINQLSVSAKQASDSVRQFHLAIDQLNQAAQDMQVSVSQIKK